MQNILCIAKIFEFIIKFTNDQECEVSNCIYVFLWCNFVTSTTNTHPTCSSTYLPT